MPNMIIPFFAGMILSNAGIYKGLIGYALVVTIGQYMCTLGGYWDSFSWLVAGRIVYGLGGETLQVV